MKKLSICLIHHSNKKLLEELISSIEASNINFSYKITILDNSTKDDFIKTLQHKYNYIDIIMSDEINGYAYNQNIILKKNIDKFSYHLVINDDTFFIDKNSLQIMINFLDNNDDVIACSPQILNKDLTPQPVYGPIGSYLSHMIRMTNFSKLVNKKLINLVIKKNYLNFFPKIIKSYLSSHDLNKVNIKVDKISGCCMLIRNDGLHEIGFFDDINFDMYCDDTDWCLRANRLNRNLFKVSDATIIHYGGMSNYPGMIIRKETTIIKYLEKHYKKTIMSKIYLLLLIITSTIKAIFYLTLSISNKNNIKFCKEYFKLSFITIRLLFF
jgi:GT2 family glycosyltransferase